MAAPNRRTLGVAIILSIFFGGLGVDRFYLGYIGLGILKLITFGGCGVWHLIDVILISVGSVKDADGNELARDLDPDMEPGQRSLGVAVLLGYFLGFLGVDRFYLGYIGLGILKLLTFGGCGLWTLIDLILIALDKVPDADGAPLRR